MVNVSNFKEFVEKINRDINEKYDNFSVQLYNARKKLRNKSGRSKYKLFSLDEKFLDDNYDYNIGGQTEVQYHIRKSKSNYIYYGLGFSFESSMSNPNPFDTVKPFTDTLFIKEVQIYIDTLIEKGYNPFIHNKISSIDDFKEPEFGKYYLFGKSLVINNDEISDEDYEQMLKDFTTDLFELYKKIFEERNKFLENNDIQIDDEHDLLSKCQELLESNYNLILTGAPGTGKTYLAKQIAAKMIFGEDKNLDEMSDDEKAKFKEQYKFVQFHPSYDYTDFVEGIRPVTKEYNNYGFERKDGIFKEFCNNALKNYKPVIYENDVKGFCDYIKTIITSNNKFKINGIGGDNVAPICKIDINDNDVRVEVDTPGHHYFKKSYDDLLELYKNYISYINSPNQNYNEFVKTYNMPNGQHTYIHGFLQAMYEYFNKKFIFVIDEINRGDINKILGELFYAIDLGYRGEKGKVDTQYQNLINTNDVFAKGFYIPENVYIIGTMNDIDRSVESMDFAIRRRFAWQEVKPEDTADEILKDLEIDKNVANLKQKAVEILKKINNCIAGKDKEESTNNILGEMYQIGASYFLKLDTYFKAAVNKNEDKEICIKEAYQKLWDNHLKGLIHEYVRGKKSGEEIFDKIKNKYFDLTGINCKENNEDTAE